MCRCEQAFDLRLVARLHRRTPKEKTMQGKSLGVCIFDYNNDSWPDIIVANDLTPNHLFRNDKDGTFSEVAAQSVSH
jgi:hypothetical protein